MLSSHQYSCIFYNNNKRKLFHIDYGDFKFSDTISHKPKANDDTTNKNAIGRSCIAVLSRNILIDLHSTYNERAPGHYIDQPNPSKRKGMCVECGSCRLCHRRFGFVWPSGEYWVYCRYVLYEHNSCGTITLINCITRECNGRKFMNIPTSHS